MDAPRRVSSLDDPWVTEILTTGGVVSAPTDTLLGLLADAQNSNAVKEVYKLKGRDENKPPIVLISDIEDLEIFSIIPDAETTEFLKQYWPGKVTVILPVGKQFPELSRKSGGIAFRVPNDIELQSLLRVTGPLIAPSANPQGKKPAQNSFEAEEYFGSGVTLYVEGEAKDIKPSSIVSFVTGIKEVIRGELG
ncbi:MAG: L-threonylcarbamoyladenylate synthase [Candidatus Paceibacterota bacterium]